MRIGYGFSNRAQSHSIAYCRIKNVHKNRHKNRHNFVTVIVCFYTFLIMGKVKPKIPSGKFVLLNRLNANGEAAIHFRFHLDGYVKRSTGINIRPSDWDDKTGRVKNTNPRAAQLNAELDRIRCEVNEKLLAYDGEINKTVLNFILNGGDPTNEGDLPDESPTQVVTKNTSFVEYCKKVNDLKYGKAGLYRFLYGRVVLPAVYVAGRAAGLQDELDYVLR